MPAPFDTLLFWLLAGIGVILTGISKSGFAGGAGVVAVPLLAFAVPLPLAAVIMLPVLLFMDIRTIHLYRKHASLATLKHLVPAAFVGIALGGSVMGMLSTAALELITGVISIVFASWQWISSSLQRFQQAGWFWGTVSGVTSTLIHAGGPPINVYFLGRNLPKLQWLGTAAVLFGVMNLTKVIPYSLNGFWELRLLLVSVLLLPAAWLGVQLGHGIQQRIGGDTFTRICRVLLMISGAGLVVKGLFFTSVV
ncbi:sulfite exporter TauE/SafE family protein [Marinobacter caseinilyticus]|uniref:sulfite exporter TauE/SafE family protein n=1 Tax=Marinobacter caseinilyticus TaxID=2692195 RepID=UPI00140D9B67|nr:sulfite exporter TauE/SafE family protein [Marinobacter caseinilyticus]